MPPRRAAVLHLTCRRCGGPMSSLAGHRRRFCSDRCRKAAQRDTAPRTAAIGRPAMSSQPRAAIAPLRGAQTPEAWADELRARYELGPGDDQILVGLVAALAVRDDPTTPPGIRLRAMSEVRSAIRQLGIPQEETYGTATQTSRRA